MSDKEKLELLEEMLDMDEGTLSEDKGLKELENWDSMAIVALITLMDEKFGKSISISKIKKFNSVRDVMNEMN